MICGCGPTEAKLLSYLSQISIPNVVLGREADINTDPRGIALDDDGIRYPQGIGIYDSIYSEIGSRMGRFNFIGGTETVSKRNPFFSLDYSTISVVCICRMRPLIVSESWWNQSYRFLSQATRTRKEPPEDDVEYHVLRFENRVDRF